MPSHDLDLRGRIGHLDYPREPADQVTAAELRGACEPHVVSTRGFGGRKQEEPAPRPRFNAIQTERRRM